MNKKILAVDDETDILKILQNRLGFVGYQVDTAETGEEALELYFKALDEKPYDLVLLDILMPGINGRSVLRAIRDHESGEGIEKGYGVPIIMLSALRDHFMDSFQDGCDDYLTKPYHADDLLGKVEVKLK